MSYSCPRYRPPEDDVVEIEVGGLSLASAITMRNLISQQELVEPDRDGLGKS